MHFITVHVIMYKLFNIESEMAVMIQGDWTEELQIDLI